MIKVFSLDTNIVSAYLQGEVAIKSLIESAANSGKIVLSPVVLAEMLYGAELKSNPTKLITGINAFVSALPKPTVGIETAAIWSRVKADMRRRGITIPDNDLWIAASAMEHDHTVVSRDKHFSFIPGLSLEVW